MRRSGLLALVLFGAAVTFTILGAAIRIDPCGSIEETQPLAIVAALCAGGGVALLMKRRRWIWAIATAAVLYAALWLWWAITVDHCLN